MKRLLHQRYKSFLYAFNGIKYAFRQPNFKTISLFAALAIFFCVFFKISLIEWFIVLLCIIGVIAAELFNSAIEELADTTHPNYSLGIKKTKDMAAAATLIISFFSLIIGLFIFIPKLGLLFS